MRKVTWKAMMHWSIEHPMEGFQDIKGWKYRLNPDQNDWEYFCIPHWMPLEGCPTINNEYLIPIEPREEVREGGE